MDARGRGLSSYLVTRGKQLHQMLQDMVLLYFALRNPTSWYQTGWQIEQRQRHQQLTHVHGNIEGQFVV